MPDGHVELVRSSTGLVQVFGPATTWREVRLPAGADHTGVRLRVGAAAAVLRTDLRVIRDEVVVAELLDLPVQLTHSPSPAAWLASLWPLLQERSARGQDPVVVEAARLLTRPGARVDEVARRLRVGERRLRRRFERATGLTPTMHRRLTRLGDALTELRATRRPAAAIALRCGYSDQAHLVREVSWFTGQTPRTFRERRDP